MAGFGKIVYKGEYFNQAVVNVLWYRSAAWLPGQGNPFDDVQAFVDAVDTQVTAALIDCLPSDYTIQTLEGVGYDDSFSIVTASPIVKTLGSAGGRTALNGVGASICGIVDLRCGEQVQINGTGHSKRDRGYLAVGPLGETDVDNYSHIVPTTVTALEGAAAAVAGTITVLLPAVQLIPIRIHQKHTKVLGVNILDWRTYSDIKGWAVRRVASFRRSRIPEA